MVFTVHWLALAKTLWWLAYQRFTRRKISRGMGLSPDKVYRLANGPLDAQLALYSIHGLEDKANTSRRWLSGWHNKVTRRLLNRSGQSRLRCWSTLERRTSETEALGRKAGLEAWRLYDADMPEYAVAIDLYGDHALVQEYAPPKSVDPQKPRRV